MKATAVFGPPGTGKTRHLSNLVAKLAPRCPNMAVVSFTKAAAGVLTSRITSRVRYVGTLHALAFKTLNMTKQAVADEKAFAKWYGTDIEEVQMAMSVYNYSYHKGYDMGIAYSHLRPLLPFMRLEHLVLSYLNWKKTYQYTDFNDMIDMATGEVEPFDVVIVDEAQDCTDRQWKFIESIVKPDGNLIMGGDDDQCQPPGTMVTTQMGLVPIQNLDPTVHRVVSYHPGSGEYSKAKFSIKSRPFSGRLVKVEVDGNQSLYTPDHRCMVKFNTSPEAIDKLRVVYLMQRGDMFRVGETKAFIRNQNGVTFYPNNRMRQERADKLWILRTTWDPQESKRWEAYFSLKYGIPTFIFDYSGLRLQNKANQETMEFLHQRLPIRDKAEQLLAALGMDLEDPTIVKKSGGQKYFECKAKNLQPMLMEMALITAGPPAWHPFTAVKVSHHGEVYSLDVESKSKTYFADNIWTHNSIFTWAGANPHAMQQIADDYSVLSQSYRIPKNVHRVAEATVSQIKQRTPKDYAPTDAPGIVRWASYYEPVFYPEPHVVLCRDQWQLAEIEDLLVERGIAYTRNGQPSLFDRGRCQLMRAITLEDYPTIKKLSKYLKREYREDHLSAVQKGVGAVDPGTWDREASYLAIVDPCAEPSVHLSTIHGYKGEESDRIILMANCTMTTELAMDDQELYENEVRVWYVGLTRARQELTVIGYNPFINLAPLVESKTTKGGFSNER